MPHSLPPNPSLANLKKQAKTLQKEWQVGDLQALARIRASHPQHAESSDDVLRTSEARLTDCQLVLAREYGFDSWSVMKQAIEAADTELADQLLTLGVIYYYGPNPLDIPRANELLIEHPQVAEANIWSAATVGNLALVNRFLDADSALVNQNGGPNNWPPLLYLCHSRVRSADQSHDVLATAKLLLDRGADPNAHYWIEDTYKFTCVTGAIGEGEAGVIMWPPHEHAMALVTLLLEAGADPNDSQGLYNSMFSGGTHWIQLLLDHGLTHEHKVNWVTDDKIAMLDYLLAQACKSNEIERAELVLRHGANPNARGWRDHQTCYEIAVSHGYPEMAEFLVRHGAERVEPSSPQERFFNACMVADKQTIDSMRHQYADEEVASWIAAGESKVGLAAESNKLEAARLMLEMGFPVGEALYEAAWNGYLDMAQLLVDHGASARQRENFVTPVSYSNRAGHMELRGFLLDRDIDIFDAILYDRLDRFDAILTHDAEALERTFGSYTNVEAYERSWQTPLAWALDRGKADAVRALVERGADVTVRNPDGRTLIQLATEQGFEEIVQILRQET